MRKMLIFAAVLVVVLGGIFFVTQSEEGDNQYYENAVTADELKQMIDEKQDATIYFYQPTCTHCQQVSPIIVPMTSDMGIDMKVHDIAKYVASWDEYKITGTPTIIRYEEGKEVSRIEGQQTKDVYETWFKENH